MRHMPSGFPTSRLGRLAGGLGLILLGGLMLMAGVDRERLVCSRSAGSCARSRALRSGVITYALAEIRDLELVKDKGRAGMRGVVSIIDSRGAAFPLFRGPLAEAEHIQRQLRALLAGELQSFEHEAELSIPLLLFGVVAVGVGLSFFRAGAASRGEARRTPSTRAGAEGFWPPSRQGRWFLGLVALGVVANLTYNLIARRTQGTLRLVCHQRCDFQGGSCMPGGEVLFPLPPGEYVVQVWAPDLPGRYEPHTVTLVAGQETLFECKAPASPVP